MKHTTTPSPKILATLATGLFASGIAMAADIDYVKINDNNELDRTTTATDRYGTAIGIQATATGPHALTIGSLSKATGNAATALGSLSNAEGVAATALGQGSNATANAATSVGRQASASGNSSTAVGSAAKATGLSATAFGAAASAEGGNSTALGQGAHAQTGNATAVGTKAQATGSAATAVGSGAIAAGTNSVATGAAAKAEGTYAIASGNNAAAQGNNSIAIGNAAQASGRDAIANGAAASASGAFGVATGLSAAASGSQAIAIGRGAAASEDYSVALGSFATTEAAVGTNEATVEGITYSGFAGNEPVATVSVGNTAEKRTITNVAAGRIDATSTDAINGSQLYLVAEQTGKNAANIAAAKTEVVAGDNVSITPSTGANNQTIYTVSANSSTTAAGSDYINVTPTTTTGANGTTNTTYAVDLSDKTKAAIQNMVNIDDRLNDMEDDLRAGIAGATAIAFLQRPNEAGKSIVSAAVGGFRDQQALAIGYARNSDNNKWSIKAGVGINTRKDVNWGGSIGYQW